MVVADGALLFDALPREVGTHREYVSDDKKFRRWLLETNCVDDCWISCFPLPLRRNVTDWGDAVYGAAILDKIPIDIDIDQGYECMLLLHDRLEKKGYLHRIDFSGRTILTRAGYKAIGFHIFVPIVRNIQHKANALKLTQKHINELVKQDYEREYGDELVNDPIDPDNIKVGLASMSRYPNTRNIKRKRFCIPLTEKQINELNPYQIARLAKKQNFKPNYWLGNPDCFMKIPKRFDVKKLPRKHDRFDPADLPDITPVLDVLDRKDLPYCLRNLISLEKPDYEQRFWAIVAMRDIGLLPEEVDAVLRSTLHPEWYAHCVEPSPGEDMINRCFFGGQKGAYFGRKGESGCEIMQRTSKCDASCRKTHPIYF